MSEEPETWLGNVWEAIKSLYCNARYCNRCGNVHETGGVCLRGDR